MKQALFIGQAPPRIADEIPFGRTHLYRWLASVGIDPEKAARDFAFTALMDTFPGLKGSSHRVPTPEEILQNQPRLVSMIEAIRPTVIVPVGALSMREVLQQPTTPLQKLVGHRFEVHPFGLATLPKTAVIPIPHPSGASTWQYQPGNKELLQKALELLAHEVQK